MKSIPLLIALALTTLAAACINPGHPDYAEMMARAHMEDFLKSLAQNFPDPEPSIDLNLNIDTPTPTNLQDIDTSLYSPDTDFASLSHQIATDPNFWQKRVEQLHEKATEKNAHYEITNEYASALIFTGKYHEAVKVLKKQERQTPGRYETATNLGTAYELTGDLKNAKKWIQAGIERNPDSHQGTEWVHTAILNAKLALKKNSHWLEQHSITPIETVEMSPDFIAKTQKAILIQLSERLVFVSAPDPIVATLFYELGKLHEYEGDVQHPEVFYRKSLEFGTQRATQIATAQSQREFKTAYQHLLIAARSEVYREAIHLAAQAPDEDCCRQVRVLGQTLANLDLSTVSTVESITYENPDFWLALMQMQPDNQLVESILTSLFIANGELDKARRITSALSGFTHAEGIEENFGNQSMRLLSSAIDDFYAEQSKRIEKGINLHDSGEKEAAIRVYQTVTDVFPKSVWANWEIALSSPNFIQNAIKGKTDEHTKSIQALDPLFMIGGTANGSREITQLLLRMGLREIKAETSSNQERYYQFAETALLLEQYGLAALLYWKGAPAVEHPTLAPEALLARYLYCLQMLGHPQIAEQFKPVLLDQITEVQAFIDAKYAKSPGR